MHNCRFLTASAIYDMSELFVTFIEQYINSQYNVLIDFGLWCKFFFTIIYRVLCRSGCALDWLAGQLKPKVHYFHLL